MLMETKSCYEEKTKFKTKFSSSTKLDCIENSSTKEDHEITDSKNLESNFDNQSDFEDSFDDDSECSEDNVNEEELSDDDDYYHDPGSDDEQNCPICLNDFEEQQIGVPNNCRHVFCVDCILEWSKKSNSCPADRIKFQSVFVFHRIGGLFNREVSVQDTVLKVDENEDESPCQICGRSNDEATLLLCDGCDLAYHCACLTPPLRTVPAGEWFCERCKEERGEVASNAQPRLVGRTNLSERVRSRITRTRQRNVETYSNLDEQLDAIVDEVLRTAGQRFRETESSITKRQKLKKKPLKRRRSRRRRGRSKRRSKSRSRKSASRSRDVGETSSLAKEDLQDRHSLSLTGRANDLNDFSGSSCENQVPSHVLAKRHRLLTQSAIKYNTPLPSLFSLHAEATFYPPLSPPPPMPDLLSSILGGQDLLFTPCSKVTIKRNGSLEMKKEKKFDSTWNNKQSSEKTTTEIKKDSSDNIKLDAKTDSSEDKTSDGGAKDTKSTTALLLDELKKNEPTTSQSGFLTRTSASASTSKASIMIKPIFSLPKPKKPSAGGEENEEGWHTEKAPPSKEEAYDPFRPTETDDELEIEDENMSDDQEEEEEDEEEEESAPEPSSSSDSDSDMLPLEPEEVEITPVPETKAEPTIVAASAEDDFEIDIFAEEELEKAEAEANRKVAESLIPDPLKMWREEARQSSVREDPHITLPTPRLKDSSPLPMKFKKRSRRDVPEAEAKSHYRSNKSVKQDEKSKKIKKAESRRRKPSPSSASSDRSSSIDRIKTSVVPDSSFFSYLNPVKASRDDGAAHAVESSRRSRKFSDKRSSPPRSEHHRETFKSTRKRRSPSPSFSPSSERVQTFRPTSSDRHRTRNWSDDRRPPFEDTEKSRKRGSHVTHPDKSKKLRRVDESKAKSRKVQLSPKPFKTPPTYHNIDDDLLWSLNPPEIERKSDDVVSSKSRSRKKHEQVSSDKPKMESSVEMGIKHRRKYRTHSSESERETAKKKKKKKRDLPKRSSSSESSIEEKKIKKKKKVSRSPRKKGVERKIVKRNHDKDSKPKKVTVSRNVSFEHIFADFDDIKKTKKKKNKKKDEKKKSKKVAVPSDEEVIYEYESLSEGEIVSSNDGTANMNMPNVIVINPNGNIPVKITPVAVPNNLGGGPLYTLLSGASGTSMAPEQIQISKSLSPAQNEIIPKSKPDPPLQTVPTPVETPPDVRAPLEAREVDLVENDDDYVVEEMVLESSPPPEVIVGSELNKGETESSDRELTSNNEHEVPPKPEDVKSEQLLSEPDPPVASKSPVLIDLVSPPITSKSSDVPLQTLPPDLAPGGVFAQETRVIEAKPYVTAPDDVSSQVSVTSEMVSIQDEKHVTTIEDESFEASQEEPAIDSSADHTPGDANILPLLDYLKALKRGSLPNTESLPPRKSAATDPRSVYPEQPLPLPPVRSSGSFRPQWDPVYPVPCIQPHSNETRFTPVDVNTMSSNQISFKTDPGLKSTFITVNNNYSKPQSEKKTSKPDKAAHHEFDPLMIHMSDSYSSTSAKPQVTVTAKSSELYSPSFPISPSSSEGLKSNNVIKMEKMGSAPRMSIDEKVTRYLQNVSDSASDSSRLVQSSLGSKENRSSKASQAKKSSDFPKSVDFQKKVVEAAKTAIMPYFKRREVSKEQYKEIMKKAVNKMCKDAKVKGVEPEKVARLIRKYVGNCLEINEKHKEKMRLALNRKVDKHMKKKNELDFSTSPPSPTDDSPSAVITYPKKSKLPHLSPPPYPPTMIKKKR